jgi:hypothetical protein
LRLMPFQGERGHSNFNPERVVAQSIGQRPM